MSLPSTFERDAVLIVCPGGQISLQRGKEQAVFSAANYIWCIRKLTCPQGEESYSEVVALTVAAKATGETDRIFIHRA